MLKVVLATPLAVGTKPEKNPPAKGTQGLAKDDCVTVWFFGKYENTISSPISAVKSFGEYARAPSPTETGICFAETAAARAKTVYVVNCMVADINIFDGEDRG